MKYNEEVAYDLGLSLEDLYVLQKIEDKIKDTNLSTYGDKGEFTFNQVDLFKICKFVFKQVIGEESEEDIKKIYKSNNAKFNKMLKGSLGKIISKGSNIKNQRGSESYFKINQQIRTILINGYPSVVDTELSDIEKLVMRELNMHSMGKNIRTQLKSMDENALKEAIQISKEHGILDYPYVRGIYNNLVQIKNPQESANSQGSSKNLISQNINTNSITQNNNFKSENSNNNIKFELNSKIHNFPGSCNFRKYTPEELEKLLQESQKNKFK